MASGPSAKRQRLDEAEEEPSTSVAAGNTTSHVVSREEEQKEEEEECVDIAAKLETIPAPILHGLIARIVSLEPTGTLAQMIDWTYDDIIYRERTRVINFDYHSRNAWHVLNKKYARRAGYAGAGYYHESDAAEEAESAVENMLDDIVARTTTQSSFGTKVSAIETMRKILKSTCLVEGVIGHELRSAGRVDWGVQFVEVLDCFTAAELVRLRDWNDGRGPWIDKLIELRDLANGYCIFEELGEATHRVRGEEETEEEEDQGGEDEDIEDQGSEDEDSEDQGIEGEIK